MIDYSILFSFAGATALLAISPGPDNVFVLIQSLNNGVKYGLATVYGLISGCIVHTTLVAFGVSAIIRNNDHLFFTLKVLGASYLAFLAYKVFKSPDSFSLENGKIKQKSTSQLFRQGFLMNVLNPKVSIFFLALFPGFLFSSSLSPVIQFFSLGLLFMAVSLIIFSLIAFGAGKISEKLTADKRIGKILKWLQITVFIAIAIYILFSNE